VTTLSRWAESAAHDPKKPVGHLADGAEAALTPLNLNERHHADAETQLRRLANKHGCTGRCGQPQHQADTAALADVLLALGLRQAPAPPAAPQPRQPRRGEDARRAADGYLRRAAEAYLEARKPGPHDVHGRMAAILGENIPGRQLGRWGKRLTGRCKERGWLTSSGGPEGSVAGPRLEQARAQDDCGAPP